MALSESDCQEKFKKYWQKYGHEGTASFEFKKKAFEDAYWSRHPLLIIFQTQKTDTTPADTRKTSAPDS